MPGESAIANGTASRRLTAGGVFALAALALVLLATTALWAHYGTAVFLETIMAGIAACF